MLNGKYFIVISEIFRTSRFLMEKKIKQYEKPYFLVLLSQETILTADIQKESK